MLSGSRFSQNLAQVKTIPHTCRYILPMSTCPRKGKPAKYSKLCYWHYIYLITVFLYCAFVIVSHNNKIIAL